MTLVNTVGRPCDLNDRLSPFHAIKPLSEVISDYKRGLVVLRSNHFSNLKQSTNQFNFLLLYASVGM